MLDTYRGGYKKALLDVRNLLDSVEFTSLAKSKSKLLTLEKSILDLLLSDPPSLEYMMEYGQPVCRIAKDMTVKPIREM